MDLTDAALIDTDLAYADLRGANLAGALLQQADLRKADLSDADLTGASLITASLLGATLNGANLTGADLGGAVLIAADLRGANLTGANLMDATLAGADLAGVDLTDTIFGRTTLGLVDLSSAIGLSMVRFERPCPLDPRVRSLSRGVIPESFLRGCGWDDGLIAYSRSLVSNGIEYSSCFISYSHSDKTFARRLHDQLQGEGIRCWRDAKSLKGGDRILKGVFEAIRSHDKLVLCCSANSLSSNWVEREISKAIEKELKEGRDILIPLNLDGHLFQWDHHLGDEVRSRLALDFTGWETNNAIFEEQFQRVVQALRDDVPTSA